MDQPNTPPILDSSEAEPLRRWNALARTNAEDAIVSSMFVSSFAASAHIEKFSTWLLVGTTAIAAFFITNVDHVLPVISQRGFRVCGVLLCASCLVGFTSKIYAVLSAIRIETTAGVRQTFAEHFKNHQQERKKIEEGAKFWGITLETGIRMDRILSEFIGPLPVVARWMIKKKIAKLTPHVQMGYIPVIDGIKWQGLFAGLQALSFFGFLIAGFWFAAQWVSVADPIALPTPAVQRPSAAASAPANP